MVTKCMLLQKFLNIATLIIRECIAKTFGNLSPYNANVFSRKNMLFTNALAQEYTVYIVPKLTELNRALCLNQLTMIHTNDVYCGVSWITK